MSIGIRVEKRGPLFDGRGGTIVRREVGRMVPGLGEVGEERLSEQARPRPAGVYLAITDARPGKASTGNYRRNISSVVRNLIGRITDGGVIYGPWLEGISSRNQRTRFKGYAMFRRVAGWMRAQQPRLARKAGARLARALGGR